MSGTTQKGTGSSAPYLYCLRWWQLCRPEIYVMLQKQSEVPRNTRLNELETASFTDEQWLKSTRWSA